jgi:hypothetical protein
VLLLFTTAAQYHEKYKQKISFAAKYLCYQLYDMLNVLCYTWLASRRQALELSHIKKKFIDKPATQACNCFTTFICTPNNLYKKLTIICLFEFWMTDFEEKVIGWHNKKNETTL